MNEEQNPPPTLNEVSEVWSQDSDCCDDKQDGQYLTISTQDGGGGPFIIIKTERWAIDEDQIDDFCKMLKTPFQRFKSPKEKKK